MGKIDKTYADELIPETSDRNSNRLRVYRAPNGEVTIHFRNMKIVLLSPEEIKEWKEGFQTALDNLGEELKNDI